MNFFLIGMKISL